MVSIRTLLACSEHKHQSRLPRRDRYLVLALVVAEKQPPASQRVIPDPANSGFKEFVERR